MSYKLLFLDTETTGNQKKDRLVQVAYKIEDKKVCELFLAPIPIEIEAMEVTHITNHDVADKDPFIDSSTFKELQELLADENTILVAHNAPFDVAMLEKEGLTAGRVIDTLRVARHMDPDGKIQAFRLQYLRYLLDLDLFIDEPIQAHDAMGDVLVLEQLTNRLLDKIMTTENISRDTAIEAMIELTNKPVLHKYFMFGKYKNKSIESVAQTDPGYLKWLLGQKKESDGNEEDWIFTLETYLGK